MRPTATSIENGALDEVPRLKTPKAIDDSIDFDRCCACFGLYADDAGTDRQWIECSCRQWIHEDYVENIIYDANGKELLCPVEAILLYRLVAESSHEVLPLVSYSLGTKVWPIIGILHYAMVSIDNLRQVR